MLNNLKCALNVTKDKLLNDYKPSWLNSGDIPQD